MSDIIERLRRGLDGRYRIDREIGSGGMAVVYLAEDLRHGRPVAIKVLRPELAAALGADRFLREIATVAKLTHPHILPLHDSGTCDGVLFYVMPYVDGLTLRDRLEQDGPLPVETALRITREVADALGYAHALGLVHRDVKPENILFQAGHALVSDFGIARAVRAAGGARITESGTTVGTLLYMSPEQAAGSADLDACSDVYSLGCVLQEMLTGVAPFGGGTDSRVLPPGVRALVEAMMRLDPAARPASGERLLGTIDGALRALGDPSPPTVVVPARKWTRTRLAALLALPLAVAVWVLIPERAPAIRSLAVLLPEDLSADSTQGYFASGVHDALIGELAGIRSLRVISRTSTLRYRASGRSVPEIAAELGVDAVVEGTMSRVGDRVTMRIHLIQARPVERDLGSDAFERDLRGVLSLYQDAARAIVTRLGLPITPDEAARLASARSVDPVAYDAYLRGMSVLRDGVTTADLSRGLALLNDAVAKDSTDPLPWAGLAMAYDQIGHLSGQIPDAFARARAAAEHAHRLGGDSPETDAALAMTLLYDDWDHRAADSLFERALLHNRSLPEALAHYGWSLLLSGHSDSAMVMLQRAEEVDPLSGLWPAFTASAASWTGQRNLAHASIRRALKVNPDLPITHYIHGTILALDGDHEAAIAAERRAVALNKRWTFGLGYVLARAGQREEARGIAAELARDPDGLSAWGIAEIHAFLGEPDAAFHSLEVSRAARWNWMPWLDFNPAFAPLRDDPRFETLLRSVGAPRCASCAGRR